ncbi:hypothetical protein [Methanosarcina sp.]|uniref:hypothetical protein n=1 Tax=Methanosarcina sp. TaxID=2213 RepID=UPI0029888395|nr:hypothetical protein [Methanosarcina sp.]MDW5550202.1 hypothetical protein [Methanosarcina sp.]MDW5555497.1 hypothetical protein [Methanosarcina sp.]MDW5560579.1 hypothetical protein [Methanosarcina sp.]
MSTEYKITVVNDSPYPQDFYFFQQPAEYVGGINVFTNSIGQGRLLGNSATELNKDQLLFKFEQQYYAGAQEQKKTPVIGEAQVNPVSQVQIDLAPNSGQTNDCTTLITDEGVVHLSDPAVPDSGVQKGAFRIKTKSFNPAQKKYNIGLSSTDSDGEYRLSSFIEAQPNQYTDVKPKLKFYVSVGTFTPGTVVDFTTSSASAAECDANDGTLKFKVTYKLDGTWDVEKMT